MSDTGPVLNLYYRHNCHLCEDMWEHLQEIRKEYVFEIVTIDITGNTDLEARHGTRIPVLETEEGKELCNYYLDERGLLDYLNA